MGNYVVNVKGCDPRVVLQMPMDLYKELLTRSMEYGRDLDTEIIVRLARSVTITKEDKMEYALLDVIFNGNGDVGLDDIEA